MKKVFLLAVVFIVCVTAVTAAPESYQPIIVSVLPTIHFPPDSFLFRYGGGVELTGAFVLPFFRPFSVGVDLNYDLALLRKPDVGNPGSVSLISAGGLAELRFTLFKLVDLFVGGGAGYFFAFINDEPSSNGSNFVWFVHGGLGLRLSSSLAVDAQGEFRTYGGLYQRVRVGAGVSLRLGGGA